MKRSIIPFAAAALILFGCQEKPEPVPEPEAKLEVSPASISFDSSASEKTITITASQDWKAVVEGEGFSISSSAGKGNAEVKVSAGTNESLDTRKGRISITSGKLSAKVELTQAGEKPVILIEGDSVEVPAEGGRYEINVKYNTEYSFEIDQSAQDWLHCVGTRALQEGKIDFVVDENESADERTAKVTISGKKASNPVNTITFTQAGSIKDSVLPGEFSVSKFKKVRFAKGNLYWDGSGFQIEDNQYNFPSKWDPSHVGHFYWSKTASVTYDKSYNEEYASDLFFTNISNETAKPDFTVNGISGKYRILSANEWRYLISTSSRMVNGKPCYSYAVSGVVIEGTEYKGIFIYPDDYNGDIVSSSMTWEQINAAGIVFLPAADFREDSEFSINNIGYYWTSSVYENGRSYSMLFNKYGVDPQGNTPHNMGISVRLVTDATAYVAVGSVNIDRTEMTLAPSAAGKLYATVLPEDASDKSVTWTSSNTSVATVNASIDGSATVFAGTAGTAVITATAGDGAITASCTVTVEEEKDPVLPGEFSVGDGYTVHFSSGNLRAKKTYDIWNWGFYEHQYDYNSLNSSCIDGKRTPSSTDDEIDLFTWGYGYWSTDPLTRTYLKGHPKDKETLTPAEDWGAAIDDKGTWRTLSADEWKYLINEDGSNTIRKNKVKTGVTVCDHTNCIILVPDVCLNSYSFDSSKTSYSSEEWAVAEAAGLVCLPAAGMSSWDYTINGVGKNCNYWTSSSSFISSDHTGESSYCAQASKNGKFTCDKGGYRPLHYAVRLVTGAPAPPSAIVAVESVSIDRAELALIPGDAAKLYATVLPENATDKSVSWTSSNTSVAKVDPDSDGNATIYCYNVGTTIITVTTIDGSKTATCTVTVEAEKDPVLPGEFSVGEGHTVRFSKGNLKAVCEIPKYRWCFANNQYDYIGDAPGNTTIGNQNVWDVVDLFGWSTVANNFGINLSLDENDYSGDFVDWGKNIHDENKWRTLSKDEWEYLFSTTSRMINGKPCYSNAVNGVTIGNKIYKGVFLYPDNYNGVVVSDNSMTWDQINAAGIVFLPSTGYRYSSTVYEIGMYCFYWTSSAYDNENAYAMYSNKKNIDSHVGEGRCSGFAVRLVTDATIPLPPPSLPEGALAGEFSVSSSKKVHFSQGNLFWDGDSFEFEAKQNDFPTEWNGSHVGHFYWSKNASVASAKSYSESGTSSSDIFFTNSSAEKAHPDFTVAGEKGKYRILSKKEWEYLINSRTVNGGKGNGKSFSLNITYESKMGIVLYPDNYKGEVLSGTISNLPDGVVFLSAAGYRYEMDIDNDYSCYWASDAGSSDLSYEVFFDSSYIYPDSDDDRSNGAAVRLVTDIN